MRLLIVGASGLVGSHCYTQALHRGFEVQGTYRTTPVKGMVHLDLENLGLVHEVVGTFRPQVVLCCAAWSWVDGCEDEPSRAFRENRDQPAALAKIAHSCGARFVYFSSSYVFNGEGGPYSENDVPDPLSTYGRSKLQGEEAVLIATEGEALIVRTMGVFGSELNRKNFVYQFTRKLRRGERMRVPADQLGNATFSEDLALGTLALLRFNYKGIWNLAGGDPSLDRVSFARIIADKCGLDASLIDPVTTRILNQRAKRPLHAGLTIQKAIAGLNWKPRNLEDIDWQAFMDSPQSD